MLCDVQHAGFASHCARGNDGGRVPTPYTLKKPAPVNVNYRMAYVGTISFHDAAGEELATRRYAVAANESPTDRIVTPLMADLRTALRQVPTLAVGVLQRVS